jgi:anti-sigma B factor antagonist
LTAPSLGGVACDPDEGGDKPVESADRAEPGAFTITTDLRDGVLIVHVRGELDQFSTAPFRDFLSQAAATHTPPRILIDAEDLVFCDFTGLSVLMYGVQLAQEAYGTLVLSGVHGGFARMLRFSGLDEKIAIFRTIDEATAYLTKEDG